jgi:NhaP-type Na+/H+ or K+/H+ antiporter
MRQLCVVLLRAVRPCLTYSPGRRVTAGSKGEAATLSTDQILAGLGLIIVLAVGSQVLASQLRVPALIIMLPAGFTAGAITGDVNPERLLGPAFHSLVSLAVAVILYNAGLGLGLGKMARNTW